MMSEPGLERRHRRDVLLDRHVVLCNKRIVRSESLSDHRAREITQLARRRARREYHKASVVNVLPQSGIVNLAIDQNRIHRYFLVSFSTRIVFIVAVFELLPSPVWLGQGPLFRRSEER